MAELKERTGWAIVNNAGDIISVSVESEDAAIRLAFDFEGMSPEGFAREWLTLQNKYGARSVKVRISAPPTPPRSEA